MRRHENKSNIAVELNSIIKEIINNTPPYQRPIRSTEIEERQKIKVLCKQLGYKHVTSLLKDLIQSNNRDLLTNLADYDIDRNGRYHWYFDLGSDYLGNKVKTKPIEKNYNFKINLNVLDNKFFTKQEIKFLTLYRLKIEQLINGQKSPSTAAQSNLIQVIRSLIDKESQKIRPNHYYERIITKYFIYENYLL
ncbi:hypothetical protein [Marinoscillum sp.]|uniref:hypothetical protein n=1 Tax=Marinoscillum sp. TaxID=2024838 RepID=UPI003BAD3638